MHLCLGAGGRDPGPVSQITGLSSMFSNARHFDKSLSAWNLSRAASLVGMFGGVHVYSWESGWGAAGAASIAFNNSGNPGINNWDVSNVKYFNNMFDHSVDFNQPIGSWDLSSAIDLSYMFQAASSFNQSLAGWDASLMGQTLVDDAQRMFDEDDGHSVTWSQANYDATWTALRPSYGDHPQYGGHSYVFNQLDEIVVV